MNTQKGSELANILKNALEEEKKGYIQELIVSADYIEGCLRGKIVVDEAELRFMKCQIKTKPCWNLIDEILGEKETSP